MTGSILLTQKGADEDTRIEENTGAWADRKSSDVIVVWMIDASFEVIGWLRWASALRRETIEAMGAFGGRLLFLKCVDNSQSERTAYSPTYRTDGECSFVSRGSSFKRSSTHSLVSSLFFSWLISWRRRSIAFDCFPHAPFPCFFMTNKSFTFIPIRSFDLFSSSSSEREREDDDSCVERRWF